MHGARLSLIVVGIVAPGSAAFGTLVGMTSGWRGGVTGQVLMRIVDVQLTLPGILFALLLGSIFGPSLRNVIMMTLEVAIVIQVEAALSFLGVGVPAGTASWGRMITEGREVMIVVVPPLCLRHLPPQGGEKGRETASPPARGGERKGDGISPAGGEKGRETAFPPQGGKEERRHFSQLARGRERGWGRGCVRGKRTLQGCVYPVATMPSGLPLPLDGIRVTDFSWIVAGPQATRILADLGADVVKVENESYIDSMRIGLRQDPDKPSLNRSGFHSNLSRNKRGITANLFHDQGREAVERLLAVSDVVIENYSAGAFARMGFSWERLQEINPSLIYVSVSGFGHVGRDASYTTWGPSAQAISGATAMSGLADRPPAGWGFSYLDHSAGYYAAIAALMALHHRARTGEAQHVDMSQIECGMVVSAVPMLDYQVNGRSYERVGNRSRYPATAPHNTYPCSGDDRWIAIAVDDEVQWGALCEVLGLDDLCGDARFADMAARKENEDVLDEAIAAVTGEREPFDLMLELQGRGVPAGVCQRTDDKQERDPQLAERGFYPTAPHEELGEHRYEGLPMQFSGARWRMDRGAPLLGEHNHAVLTELLGYSEEEFASMLGELAI